MTPGEAERPPPPPPLRPLVRTWRLDDTRQTLVLASRGGRLPGVVHWGAPLPRGEDLAALAAASEMDVTGGMLDENPDLSICPEAARSFPGQPGLICRDGDGRPILPRFGCAAVEERPRGLTVRCRDEAEGVAYEARLDLDPATHVLALSARLTSDRPLRLEWLAAPVLPGPQLSDELIEVSGRWVGEFQLRRAAWHPGIRLRENRTGRTGHEHFPGLVVPGRGATATAGEAWAFHYGWSGGHRMVAEELPDGRRQIQWGHAAGSEAAPGTAFATATLFATYGAAGTNDCATAFQRHVRDRLVPKRPGPRPVHYNCWEAVYFDQSLPVLKDIATRAAALGAERFVLDDGWFGARDDDATSLGDWQVDARKWPGGLDPLIDHVHAEGMEFGLWFEPEMASPDSALLRARPDWALGPPDQVLGRGQMALDMARAEVRDHLFAAIDAILSAHAVSYVKWDHNRVLPVPDAAQAHGFYALLDRLRAAHPAVEIESCASGGGRVDFGVLSRAGRVWLSDSNDALERLRMQHDAALFLPAAVTGSHVGPRRCHTSGRTLSMPFRAWVAAQRHMGFEMDPRELTEEEAGTLAGVTAWWKRNRDWTMTADVLRLESADPAIVAEAQLARDGRRFVVFAGRAAASAQIAPRPLRLTRLDPAARYEVALANRAEAPALSRAPLALKEGPLVLTGAALMQTGIALPWSFPETMWVMEGRRL
ncbi:alpha-galactosidase [Hasllibacter halocynthiae]|uniref:alpha-galactosidase n=1 Tax=Hasllibacter halocynthiae TaxID=595589 RepID=A0A2T0X6L0_9RHOB|nr:alpha-galactosidase [Hasllibacter halocynthiae]PRY94591.1 alpha-galactosidase [Hasllibacter halocynthiae]